MNEKVYTLALRYLARRPRSEKEVIDYLTKKKFSEDDIPPVIELLKKQNFLNDLAFANWWIDQRTRFKVEGRRLIDLELKQKGVAQNTVDEVWSRVKVESSLDKGKSELEKAKDVLERKRMRFEKMERQERFERAGAFLGRRGFDWEVIKRAIDEVFKT